MTRLLLCGVCAIAIQTGSSLAQGLAVAPDSPVTDKPMAIDKTTKGPGDLPEIIRQPDQAQARPTPRAIADPAGVLQPPSVDMRFLRAIRLDWDRLGDVPSPTSRTASR